MTSMQSGSRWASMSCSGMTLFTIPPVVAKQTGRSFGPTLFACRSLLHRESSPYSATISGVHRVPFAACSTSAWSLTPNASRISPSRRWLIVTHQSAGHRQREPQTGTRHTFLSSPPTSPCGCSGAPHLARQRLRGAQGQKAQSVAGWRGLGVCESVRHVSMSGVQPPCGTASTLLG